MPLAPPCTLSGCGRGLPLVAPATAAAAEPTAAAAATTAALRPLFGLVHAQRASVHVRAVHGRDCIGRLVRVAHGHEAPAPGLPALPLGHDVNVRDFAGGNEGLTECLRRRAEGKIAHVES